MIQKIICMAIIIGIISGSTCFAMEDTQTVYDDLPAALVINSQTQLPATSSILIEQTTGNVLYEYNPDVSLPPASITKIMTLLLVIEALERGEITLDTMVTCSEHANSMGGSQIWFKVGEQLSVHDLLKATAISSANDSAVALAEQVSGSEEEFVIKMNERAKELGMNSTNFVNATGLDAENHLSTARDIAIMSAELLRHPKIIEYSTIWMDNLRGGKTELVNTNKLVRFYKGATGLKTGTTNKAGYCLSGSATRDNLSLIAVTMGSKTSDERFSITRGLLDYGFNNFAFSKLEDISEKLAPIPVKKGVAPEVCVEYAPIAGILINKSDKGKVQQEITLAPYVRAPIEKGQKIGTVVVHINGEKQLEYPLIAKETIDKMTFTKAFTMLLKTMCGSNC
ncbi:MAG: D-alanyl-D-alanine carboxypeptidase family protein [Oscillospiraceae bacterium]